MPPHVRIEMFGGLRIIPSNGSPVMEVPPHRAGILLALLALDPGRSITREELIDMLWPDDGEVESRRRLRQTLHELRAILEPTTFAATELIRSSRASIHLNAQLISTDVMEFESGITSAGTLNGQSPLDTLRSTVDLYRGELLPGFYIDVIQSEQRRLQAKLYLALTDLAREYEATGDRLAAIETLQRMASMDPLAEDVHCSLMRLYADMGRPSDVVRQYNSLARTLRDELSESPHESTAQLFRELRNQTSCRIAAPLPVPASEIYDVSSQTPEHRTPPSSNISGITGIHPLFETPISRREPTRQPYLNRQFKLTSFAATMACSAILIMAGWIAGRIASGSRREPLSTTSMTLPTPAASGSEAWTQRYVPASDERDSEPTAIAIDSARDVYVTGFVQTRNNDVDFLTLKYDRNGPLLWKSRYNGTGNDVDRARAIAVDNDGNVLVTGESDNGKGNGATRLAGLDYATVKLNGRTGEKIWEARYNPLCDGEDRPSRITADDDDNCYVTGSSWDHKLVGGGAAFAIATVKYGRDGKQIWAQRFASDPTLCFEATDMALDRAQRRLYVAGVATEPGVKNGRRNQVLAAYDLDGRLLWNRIFPGTADKYNLQGSARLVLDGVGGVILAGSSMFIEQSRLSTGLVVDLSCDGRELWRNWIESSNAGRELSVTDLALAPKGDVVVLSRDYVPNGPFSVFKLSIIQHKSHSISEASEPSTGVCNVMPFSLACDRDGNVVVSGCNQRVHNEMGPIAVPELLAVKYSSGLHELWRRTSYAGEVGALAAASDGSAVVTGRVVGQNTNDILTVQYNP